ncbi:Flp family type IVb pilin [Veronia pacifica]|uniref:Pilus assembly protein n=1 Tax=Veronia pacifica TaxID=1080227 RepID=A0A1C3ESA1_9GAMM|nr:Flp family type IVb pilin [Veronia pacifica]ODA36085.1 hypothetical protein A8L45_00320 [Veronia pacifica]
MLTKLVAQTQAFLYSYKNDERGVTAVEYGLIAVAMATALALIFSADGNFVSKLVKAFEAIGNTLSPS